MSTTASASASARTQSEADELFRVASAEMAVTTCEVSSVGGGGGDRYAPLPHYQVEEVKKMWEDVTEDDMAKLLAIPNRLEERRDAKLAEDAKLAKKAQKRARREGEDELAIVRGGGVDGKLRALGADVPAPARATGSDVYRRSDGDGAGRGTDETEDDERDGRGLNETEDDEAARLENTTAKLRSRDANVPSAARGLERGPVAKRARVADALDSESVETKAEAASTPNSRTKLSSHRFFKPTVGGEVVVKFGPNAEEDGMFNVYVENEAQPRRVRGDVEAELTIREELTLQARHEHASHNARDSGKHEVQSVGVDDSHVLKMLSKTIAWTSPENVGRAANDDAAVIVVASEDDARRYASERAAHFGRIINHEGEFARCFRLKASKDGSSRGFVLRSRSETQSIAACRRAKRDVREEDWQRIQKRAKTTFVYDTYAYATRPNSSGPVALTNGSEAVECAKRWIDERRREVSEYLKENVNTLEEVYFALASSPGLGDQLADDGYWNAPTRERSARVFVEEQAGDDATTKVDKDVKNDGSMNSYRCTTEIFRKDSISNSCAIVNLQDVHVGDWIATNVDGESGRPTRFKKVASVAEHAAREIVQVSLKSVPEYVAFTCGASTTLVNAAPARFVSRESDAVGDPSRQSVQEIAFVAADGEQGAIKAQCLTITVYPGACKSIEEARARAAAKAAELRQPGAKIETKETRSGVVTVTRDGEDVAKFSATAAMHSPNIVSDMEQVPGALAKRKNVVTYVTCEARAAARFEDKSAEEFEDMMRLHAAATGEDREIVTRNKQKTRGAFFLGCDSLFAPPSCAMGVRRDDDDDDDGVFPLWFTEDVIDQTFFWIGFWLGDGDAKSTSFAIADAEREPMEEALRAYASSIGAHVSDFRAAADGGACGSIYMHQPNHLLDVLRRLDLFGTKNVGATALRFLLRQTRAARLAFLAGTVDSDGHISRFDRTHIILGQSLVNTATTHGTILAAFGVVAQSLGCDVRYVEHFRFVHQIARDENGRVIRKGDANYPTREEQRKATDFRRSLTGQVFISGPAATQIPTKTDKKLDESVPFDDATGFDDATHAIRAASLGLYELQVRTLDAPMKMISLTFEDSQNDDAVALATGFRVLT